MEDTKQQAAKATTDAAGPAEQPAGAGPGADGAPLVGEPAGRKQPQAAVPAEPDGSVAATTEPAADADATRTVCSRSIRLR